MKFDWSVFVLLAMWAPMIWELTFSPTSIWRSKREVMAHVQKMNAKRGITMRPGWRYHMADGTTHMSPTGRERDMVITGTKNEWGKRKEREASLD